MTDSAIPPVPAADDWRALWIEPARLPAGPAGQGPGYYLASEVAVFGPVSSAWLHATAYGVYEPYVNGTRLGDEELRQFTACEAGLQVHSWDVTALISEGVNIVGALLSGGWRREQHDSVRAVEGHSSVTALLAELHVALRTGGTIVAGTGPWWRSAPSHILAADLIMGEVHDMRCQVPGWAQPGTGRSTWDRARAAEHGYPQLRPPASPVRRVGELPAISVTQLASGRHVADFGQDSNG